MKTTEIISIYELLSSAKINKVQDQGKIKIVKTVRKMKKIVDDFNSLVEDAREKLKGEKHDELIEKASRWQQEGNEVNLTDEEKLEINAYFSEYGSRIDEFVKEDAEKEHDLGIAKLNEEEFDGLISSNDWDVKTIIQIQELICEE